MSLPFPSPYRRAGDSLDAESETLPSTVAAIWGGFLFEGLMTTERSPNRTMGATSVPRGWAGDRLDLIEQSCRYLDRIWAISRPYWRGGASPEGVFEYEVVAAFGELLRYQLILSEGQLPEDEEAAIVIEDLVTAFFLDPDGADRPPNP